MVLTFGVLIEVLEDWIRNDQTGNRIIAQLVVDDEKIVEIPVGGAFFLPGYDALWLVTKSRNQEDIFDDSGVLLNDESPSGIYRDVENAELENIDNNIPIGIEVWLKEGEDEIQYRIDSHGYLIKDNVLIVQHILGEDNDEQEEEFRRLLTEQYL